MRFQLWIAVVALLSLTLVMACSATELGAPGAVADAGVEGGSSGSAGTSGVIPDAGPKPDAGGSSNGSIKITPSKLKDGATIILGVTTDDLIVYIAEGNPYSLEAVSVDGGDPIVIEPIFDPQTATATVSGAAVGYWTGITGSLGTFHVWTKNLGKKANLNAASSFGDFAASEDGTRIAFSVAVADDRGNLAVADTATVTATTTGIFADADRINLLSFSTCPPRIAFAKKAIITLFCTGDTFGERAARLYFVPETGTTPVRLDDVGPAAGTIAPVFFTNKAGSSIFAISSTDQQTGRIVTPPTTTAAATSVVLEDGVVPTEVPPFISDDGLFVVYRTTAGGVRRASTGAVPAPKALAPTALDIIALARDQAHMLYRTGPETETGTNIQLGDTTTENQTVKAIVATSTATSFGFTGDGSRILYLTDSGPTSNRLKSQPAAGGLEKELVRNIAGIVVAPASNGAVLRVDPHFQGETRFTSILYIDATTGDTSPILSEAIPNGGLLILKKKLVYTKLAVSGSGLYVATLP